jgi:membrane-associated protease RseP (regulator of RpoE activity)
LSNDSLGRPPYPTEGPQFSDGHIEPEPYGAPAAIPALRPRFQHKVWKHVTLFVLTLATTTLAGALHYAAFITEFGTRRIEAVDMGILLGFLLGGLWYSIPMLLILGAHEMGHYYFCRRYNVNATLPYFIPAPIPLTGTLGAVIRIREPFPTRAVLFDIGVAGPIAGFVVLVPLLFWGLAMSQLLPAPRDGSGYNLGEPLLFQLATHLMFPSAPAGYALNGHPMVFAAWFGMLATALNLLPFGQLDGGHITYATLRRWSSHISLVTVAGAVAMTLISTSWVFMTVMMVVMLAIFGPHHPRVLYEYEPLGRGRYAVAIFALVMLVMCFTPAPIEPYELIKTP